MSLAADDDTVKSMLTAMEWSAIEIAAKLALAGREAEAECTRWRAGYHNLASRTDADRR